MAEGAKAGGSGEPLVRLPRRPLVRYTLLQIPALALVAMLAWALWHFAWLPGWAATALVAAWLVKDVLFYPLLRESYAGDGSSGTARLIGQRGVARQVLAPRGYVALGELWRAELVPGAAPIPVGGAVRVVAARRLTLIVAAADSCAAI